MGGNTDKYTGLPRWEDDEKSMPKGDITDTPKEPSWGQVLSKFFTWALSMVLLGLFLGLGVCCGVTLFARIMGLW